MNDLPKYKDRYPSRYLPGTLGWVLDQETEAAKVSAARKRAIESQFYKLEKAYKLGRKAGADGLGKDANPYKERPRSRSFSEREEWFRGWRAVRRDARAASLMGF